MAEANRAPARKSTSAAANSDSTTEDAGTVSTPSGDLAVDSARPEAQNIGKADNAPSASETIEQGTPVDPTSGPQGAPSPYAGGRTGYHCGYCGESIGAEGQHYHGNGEVRETPHAGTMVVADNWPEERAANPGTSEDENADAPEARQKNDVA